MGIVAERMGVMQKATRASTMIYGIGTLDIRMPVTTDAMKPVMAEGEFSAEASSAEWCRSCWRNCQM